MKKTKGITLIALVITIIVLLILAGVSISLVTGDDGLISKASNAKEKTASAQANEEEGMQSAIDRIDTLTGNEKKEEEIEYNHDAPELHHSGIIPEGGRFVHEAAGVVTINGLLTTDNVSYELGPGDPFPETIMLKDTYYYGDYMYTMKDCDYGNAALYPPNGTYNQTGWRFEAVDKTKETYEPILESICGVKVTSAFKAFYGCSNMIETPVIPQYAIEQFVGVYNGTKVTTFSKGILPETLTGFNHTTIKCFTNSIEYIYIPESILYVSNGTINEMLSVKIKTLCISCATNYVHSTMPEPIGKPAPEEIIYYHHSSCDGTCGK